MLFNCFKYALGIVPNGYYCHKCNKRGCKLWREYQTCADFTELVCCDCAGKSQGKDVSTIDDRGRIYDPRYGWLDQIGWRIPAVPTEDGLTFWGYTSVPQTGCDWWSNLPTRV